MTPKTRTVFGRRRTSIKGSDFIIEMRDGSLTVRKMYARTGFSIPLSALASLVMDNVTAQPPGPKKEHPGQLTLPME